MSRLTKSFTHATIGLARLIRDEQNARIHTIATLIVFVAAIGFHVNRIEMAILFIAIIMVFGMEIINTAIEDLLDHLHPQQHARIARIKDAMAGAVLVSAIIAAVVAWLIFWPYVRALFLLPQ